MEQHSKRTTNTEERRSIRTTFTRLIGGEHNGTYRGYDRLEHVRARAD